MSISEELLYKIIKATGGSAAAGSVFAAIFLIVGIYLLVQGAGLLVDGAVKLSFKMKIPMALTGMTAVAIGTSAPEAAISIFCAYRGDTALAAGTITGSNIMNILLILGITAMIMTVPVSRDTLRFEIPFVILVSAVFLIEGLDGRLGKADAAVLLVLLAVYIAYLIIKTVKKCREEAPETQQPPLLSGRDTLLKMILCIFFGIVIVVVGSDITVTGANTIAYVSGIEPRIIGLTAVALGTSLPELASCIAAARKKAADIAVGNIIGSNIFNILFAGGIAGIISPSAVRFRLPLMIDCAAAVLAAAMLLIFAIKNKSLGKKAGTVMIVCYSVYFLNLAVQTIIL